jgi:hypothetical protein
MEQENGSDWRSMYTRVLGNSLNKFVGQGVLLMGEVTNVSITYLYTQLTVCMLCLFVCLFVVFLLCGKLCTIYIHTTVSHYVWTVTVYTVQYVSNSTYYIHMYSVSVCIAIACSLVSILGIMFYA